MNHRERIMLIAAVILLGGVVFYYVIYTPQQTRYAALVEARDAVAAELARDQQIVSHAQRTHREYNRLRASVAAVEQRLPDRKEIPALLTAMEQFTRRIGVTFESIRPGGLTAVKASPAKTSPRAPAAGPGRGAADASLPYSSMSVGITLQGTFAQTVEYLRQLRDFPRLVVVNSVSLTPVKFPQLGVTIGAQIYTLGTPSGRAQGAR